MEPRTKKIVNPWNPAGFTTTHRPVTAFVTIFLVSAPVAIVLSDTPYSKIYSELFNKIQEGFNGDLEPHKYALMDCAEQTEATMDDINKFLRKKPQYTHQGKCFVACVLKKTGIMKNNKIDAEKYMNANRKVYGKDIEILNHLKMAVRECLKVLKKVSEECAHASLFNDCMFLKTNHILKIVREERRREAQVQKENTVKRRANKVIKDEL